MSDLAAHMHNIADAVKDMNITRADIIGTNMSWSGEYTIHLRDEAALRIVPLWGDPTTLKSEDYVVEGVVLTHHHRVVVRQHLNLALLWVTPA